RIRENLIRAIIAEAGPEGRVESRSHREVAAGLNANNAGNLPCAREKPHCAICELWCFVDGRHVEHVTRVAWAAATIGSTAARVISGGCLVPARYKDVAYAMGPGVVALYGDAMGPAALNGQQQAVVVGCALVAEFSDVGKVLPFIRILQIENPSLVRVSCRRTRRKRPSVDHATGARLKDGWICFRSTLSVNRAGANVICRNHPAIADLPLNAEIPLMDIRRLLMQ